MLAAIILCTGIAADDQIPEAAIKQLPALSANQTLFDYFNSSCGMYNYPDDYVGAWIDKEFRLVVALADCSPQTYEKYSELLKEHSCVRFVYMKYSYNYLYSLADELFVNSLIDYPIDVFGVETKKNLVNYSYSGDLSSIELEEIVRNAGKKYSRCAIIIGGTGTDGWQAKKGKIYYIRDGEAINKPTKINGVVYNFVITGECIGKYTGWSEDKNGAPIFLLSGEKKTGWINENGSFYYLNKNSKKATSSRTIDGIRYKFGSDGVYAGRYTGWTKNKSGIYKYWLDGERQTGWVTVGENKYYLDEAKGRLTGEAEIEGDTYAFDSKGRLISAR